MKKFYISPNSEMINLVTENMIAASGLNVNGGEAEQWSNKRGGWSSEDWSGTDDEFEE